MIRPLLLSKYQFQTATKLLEPAVPMSGGVALSMLQDAVETLAWSVAKSVEPSVSDKTTFTQLWDVVKSGSKNPDKKALPLQAVMQELNKIRVNFKHYSVLPEISEAQRYFVQTEEFLRQTMKEFFERDFDSVSLADMIADQGVRDKLKEAETMLSVGEVEKSIEATAFAEHLVMKAFEKILPEIDGRLDRAASGLPHEYARTASSILEYLEKYLSGMRKTILFGLAGHKLKSYQRFLTLAPAVLQFAGGKIQFQHRTWQIGKKPATEDDAKFCIGYVTDFAIAVQERLA